jgi:hypothetical protein
MTAEDGGALYDFVNPLVLHLHAEKPLQNAGDWSAYNFNFTCEVHGENSVSRAPQPFIVQCQVFSSWLEDAATE